MSWKKGLFYGIGLTLFLASCANRENIPDVSDIPVAVKINRFEQALFSLDTNNLAAGLAKLEQQYPAFSQIYFGEILGSTDERIAPQGHEAYMKGFLTHPPVRNLYDTTQIVFSDMRDLEKDFTQAFQFFKYYFPDQPTPDVTTFISEYSIGSFIFGDSNSLSLAVGLDFFLGEHYPYQQYNPGNPNFSAYLTRTFNKAHLVPKTLQPLVEELVGPPAGNRLLDLMVHNGKKLYLLDHFLPYTPDSVKLEITAQQVKWLEDNELEMYAYFLKENLFYSSDYSNIRKYVEYSPNSPGMPAEAPGRTANWLGWQIVKAYMQRYPETTMPQLLAMRDAQQLLDASKYKPKR
ncbi:MAG: hypothetical protein ACK4TA_21370 [Saprospiraceae bacterium]